MCRKLSYLLSVVLVLGLIGSNLASAKMVGWWKFDETTGTSAADSSPSGNAGTLNGGPTWVAGQLSGGLQFDATNDYVDLPIGSIISTLSSASFTTWVNFAQPAGANWQRLFDFGSSTTINMFLTPAIGASGNMRFAITIAGSGSESNVSAGSILPTGWHHVAAIIDGTTKTMSLYLDGRLLVSGNTAVLPKDMGSTTQNWLGRSQYSADSYFGGILDDFRIYDEAVSEDTILNVIMPGLGPDLGIATWPSPVHKAVDVPRDAALGWTAGPYAATHNVYMGTTFEDVNGATLTSPALVSKGQTTTSFDPAGLQAFGQTYYWRVDEVNAAPDSSVYKGPVWNFATETYGYAVKPVKATASSVLSALMGPEKTIDSSGLDGLDQHGTSAGHMWLSKKNVTPVWIQYEFDQAYKLHEMWVWNSNQAVEQSVGFGAQDVTIETSLDGTTWTALADVPKFEQAPGEPNYLHNTTVNFAGTQAKFVKLTVTSNWADGTKQAGLAEVRFFYVPVKAYNPTPANAATGVAIDSVLNWRPGREAVKHQVVLSTDAAAVAQGTAASQTITGHSLSLSAMNPEYGRTYTWKVNEVNDAANPKSWDGDLWTFSTPEFGVVDDFESYDDNCKRIFFAWVDGFGYSESTKCSVTGSSGNGSGSTVGNTNPPFAEQTIIHGGKQSMPMAYDNSASGSSEATRTFAVAQDWTKGGAKTLVLYFRGAADNAACQLYVKINGTKIDYPGGTSATTLPIWKQWNIDLAQVSASTLKAVKTMSIGVSGTGKGMLRVDDILLYRAAPALPVLTDPGTNGIVANYRMEANVKDSSGKNNNGTASGDPVYVDGAPGNGSALKLEGIDDHVDLPIGSFMSTASSASFTLWVNWTRTGGNWQRIFDFGSSTTNYMFLTASSGALNSPMRFAIRMTTSTAESTVTSPVALTTGWHHVAVVIDGATKTMTLYEDGSVMASGATLVLPKDLGNTTQNWLGRSQFTADAYYNGAIDEFRIYNRTLTEGEVRYLAGDR